MEIRKENKEQGFFKSSDGTTQVAYYIYTMDGVTPKAIVQLSHGMQEYVGRYDDLAYLLCSQGYIVCGNDHLGHGATSGDSGNDGFMGENQGYKYVTEDLHKMTEIIRERYPNLPICLYGHSMGSFFCRYYAELYGNDLSGLIISGTGGPNPMGGIGLGLTKLLIKLHGAKAKSPLIEKLAFGAYTKRIPDAKYGKEWVTRDQDIFEKYIKDPKCSFSFTLAGYKDLMTVLSLVNRKEWAATLPKELPVFIFSGSEDPVGDYGKGVTQVYDFLKDAGLKDVSLKLYEGCRHEVHNELPKDREEFYKDLINWLNEHIK